MKLFLDSRHSQLIKLFLSKEINSIIKRCKNAQGKYAKDTCQYNRYIKMIKTINISKELIEEELLKGRE